MLQPWQLTVGPDYAQSLTDARDKRLADFDANLATLRRQARHAPWAATTLYDEDHRVSQVFDEVNGYSLAIYFTMNRYNLSCRLEWVEVGPLEPDFDPWS